MLKDSGRIIIVGAGPTGIGAAYRLKKLGYTNFKVIEAGPIAGGLPRSSRWPSSAVRIRLRFAHTRKGRRAACTRSAQFETGEVES